MANEIADEVTPPRVEHHRPAPARRFDVVPILSKFDDAPPWMRYLVFVTWCVFIIALVLLAHWTGGVVWSAFRH